MRVFLSVLWEMKYFPRDFYYVFMIQKCFIVYKQDLEEKKEQKNEELQNKNFLVCSPRKRGKLRRFMLLRIKFFVVEH